MWVFETAYCHVSYFNSLRYFVPLNAHSGERKYRVPNCYVSGEMLVPSRGTMIIHAVAGDAYKEMLTT